MSTPTDRDSDHYSVLGLTRPKSKNSTPVSLSDIKKAYHRALLASHPDKNSSPKGKPATVVGTTEVDQIIQAYKVLSDPATRAAYDNELNRVLKWSQTSPRSTFDGVESYDLDELAYNHDQQAWRLDCRCGNARGYEITEAQLEDASTDGEVLVQCSGCSLMIRILFEATTAGEP